MEEEKPKGISYRVNCDWHYPVKAKTFGDKVFYSISLQKTNYDKTKMYYTRQLRFVKCDPPEDGDVIRIISGFEDVYFGKLDKYNAIPVICVTEYEIVQTSAEAIAEYNKAIEENQVTITDEDLPF